MRHAAIGGAVGAALGALVGEKRVDIGNPIGGVKNKHQGSNDD